MWATTMSRETRAMDRRTRRAAILLAQPRGGEKEHQRRDDAALHEQRVDGLKDGRRDAPRR